MADKRKPDGSKEKTHPHRERLRKEGLRPIEIWVPDVRSCDFQIEAHRQSLAVAQSRHEADDQAFIDAVSEFSDKWQR